MLDQRPYLNVSVLGYRNFRLGLVLFYLARGTTGITSVYFIGVLRFDAWHVAALQLPTLAGIALAMSGRSLRSQTKSPRDLPGRILTPELP